MKNFFELFIVIVISYTSWQLGDAQNSLIQNPNHFYRINEMAVEMMTKCYMSVKSVIIHADTDKSTIELIQSANSFKVILISDSSLIKHHPGPQLGTDLFLIAPHSVVHLQQMLKTLKNSPWWSIKMPYFILDKSNNSCGNVDVMLRAAWKMNLLKSFFLCVDSRQLPMIYIFNPYTNHAPQPWKQVSSGTNRSDGWTMYTQQLGSEYICESLDFDKTKDLSGSIIRVVVNLPDDKHWIPDKDYNESKITEMHPVDSFVAKLLKKAWNVTLIINVDGEGFNLSGEPDGFYKRLHNGSSDLALCLRSRHVIYNFTPTYPAVYSKYHIFTNNRGFYTPWEKIKNFYGLVTLASMSVILPIVFIVVFLSGRKLQWSFAGFELLRLLVNAAMLTRMNTLSLRIFYTMIFLYFLIIHATFAGHISAFLTKDQYRSNVESLEDLRDSRYQGIHIGPALESFIDDPILEKKLIIGNHDSIPNIIGNESAACIADILTSIELTFKHQLHMSKRPVGNSLYGFVVRDDWPLKERFDLFMMQLEHAKLFRKLIAIHIEKQIESQRRLRAMSEIDVRPIALPMLDLPFIFFAVGLALATICLAFELLILNVLRRRRLKRRTQRRTIRTRRVN